MSQLVNTSGHKAVFGLWTTVRTWMVERRLGLVAAVGLLVCTGGPSYYLSQHLVGPPGGWLSWIYLIPFGTVGLVGSVAVWNQLRRTGLRESPWPLIPIAAYLIWALLSVLWTVAPLVTPLAAFTGIGIAAFGCWFGWKLSIEDQMWAVALSTACASILSAIVIIFWPLYGKMYVATGGVADRFDDGAAWQGIFGNRNSLSPVCTLGLIGLVGLIALRPSIKRAVAMLPIALIHGTLLWNSSGLTAMVALGLVTMTAVALPQLSRLKARRVPGLAVAITAALGAFATWVVIFSNFEWFAENIGRDPTLSGRRQIWAHAREFFWVHPVRGYGFWAIWERPEVTAESYARLGNYGSAHNAALEVAIGLGVVGLVFYLGICGAAIGGPFAWYWSRRSTAAWWWALVVVFVVAEQLMESFVLWHSYIWVLFIAAAMAPFGRTVDR